MASTDISPLDLLVGILFTTLLDICLVGMISKHLNTLCSDFYVHRFSLSAMPLRGQRKVLTKRKRSRSAPPVLQPTSKKVKRKQWTNEQMERAIAMVQSGASIYQAARDHNVPRTTLWDRISGRVEHKTNPGPRRYLNETEEKEFADFLIQISTIGYGKSRRDVMNIAEAVAKQKGLLRKSKITQGWWREFLKRQDDLSLRRGDNTANVRMDAVNEDTITHYFDLLKKTLEENGLINSPERIYNVDETGVPLDPKAPNVVTRKGTKKVRYRSTGKKGQITVVACGSATGQIIPPTVIFESKHVKNAWTRNELPGMSYGCSDSGWITADLFESWLCDHFLKHAVGERPLLLLLDGHSTHYQLKLIRYARQKRVVILCLPPHTTQEAQPLDCAVFSPLKAQWKTVCHEFFQANPRKIINNFNFVSLFTKAWMQAVTPANIAAGFKTCGVYPLDPSAIRVVHSIESLASQAHDQPSRSSLNDDQPSGSSLNDDQPSGSSLNDGHPNDTAIHDLSAHPSNSSALESGSYQSNVDNGGNDFTAEQEELFKKRYEEGYDLFIDADYVKWIKIHYPDTSLPIDNASISDFFSDIAPASPVEISVSSPVSPLPLNQFASSTETEELASSMDPNISTVSSDNTARTTAQSQTMQNIIVTSSPVVGTGTVMWSQNSENVIVNRKSSPLLGTVPQSKDSETNVANIIVTSSPAAGTMTTSVLATPRTSISPLANYLIHSAPDTTPTAPKRSVPRARLLTSDESLALLEQRKTRRKWHF